MLADEEDALMIASLHVHKLANMSVAELLQCAGDRVSECNTTQQVERADRWGAWGLVPLRQHALVHNSNGTGKHEPCFTPNTHCHDGGSC